MEEASGRDGVSIPFYTTQSQRWKELALGKSGLLSSVVWGHRQRLLLSQLHDWGVNGWLVKVKQFTTPLPPSDRHSQHTPALVIFLEFLKFASLSPTSSFR